MEKLDHLVRGIVFALYSPLKYVKKNEKTERNIPGWRKSEGK
jgi:hypothetical protein